MKFKIIRESGSHLTKPLKWAKMMPFEKWEVRSCTEEQFEQRHAPKEGSWRSVGTNHTTTRNGKWIKRQMV